MLRICENCIHNKVCNEWAVTSGIPFVNANTCENFMTADVVPREEVEKLEEYIDDLNDSKEHLCVMLEEARADVAREIIVDIDDRLYDMAMEYHNAGHPEYFAVCEMVHHKVISAVEKKYTEGEK